MLGMSREQLSDSVPNAVPLAIIVALTVLFIAYNPWGWQDWFLIIEIFGLHLVPLLVLGPVTYVLVKLVSESTDGESETANRVKEWFATELEESADGNEASEEKHDGEVPASR